MASGTPLYGDRAPTIGQYVVIAGSALLDNERTLTGTTNQIVVTDNGAGSTVVLSTPQDIHTTATPTFDALTLNGLLDVGFTNTANEAWGVKSIVIQKANANLTSMQFGAAAQDATMTYLRGSQGYVYLYAADANCTVSAPSGLQANIFVRSASGRVLTISTFGRTVQVDSPTILDASGTITISSMRGVNIGNQGNANWASAYGIYVEAQTGSTNNYSIYSAGGGVHLDQSSNTGAIPVLFLDQGDVSEQCIEFSSDATDRDIHLFTVNVTGVPAMDWLETADIFSLNKGLDVSAGAISSATLTLSAAGPTDNLDVSGVNAVFINTADNNVTLGGTVGGVDGQVLYIAVHDATNNFTIENVEGTGNQDFYLHAGADETMTAEHGGWVFVNMGGDHWHDCSHAKHV